MKDNIRSIETIEQVGKELIEKMKMIDEEINIIIPNHSKYGDLSEENKSKLGVLYNLKNQYNHKFDMILVALNEDNRIANSFMVNKLEELEELIKTWKR